ncbi:MAG: alanine/ornithine racemase family PLP-dependent enzyme [Coriobacteriia bacterium]|nr:alanine/ornithine racemase family PLP-dependent enzyme [Coriobacteriia bacterium]
MLARATLTVDLAKIEENARLICEALPGIGITGVTKVTCGTPEVARAMLAGGVTALGESRLENVARMREAGITAPMWLVRAPSPGQADEAVALADVSLVSEIAIADALEGACARAGKRHGIVAMVDIGDLREGMWPDALPAFLDHVAALPHIDIVAVGASLTCYGAIVPDENNLGVLARLAAEAGERLGRPIGISGGSSTSIDPVLSGRAPAAIDNLRLGEAIVLGVDPATRERIPGLEALHTDALTVSAPVIECTVKPSLPIGVCAQDAFGNVPSFEDLGRRRRAICALGRQDAPPEGLVPVDPRVKVLGGSSDHLVLDVEDLPEPPAIGDALAFTPGYSATLALFTSPYVDKVFVGK